MPDGVVQWFDPASGEGRILHDGRRFAMHAGSSEPAARVPGARVHFDIQRADAAGNVMLQPGTRTSRRQRRFGDLTGAATPDAKGTAPYANRPPEPGRDAQRHPMLVVERWAARLAAAELDEAMLLYAPGAALHVGGEVVTGLTAIRAQLADSPLCGGPPPRAIEGEGGTIVVRWAPAHTEGPVWASHLRVVHGEIAEQWLGAVWAITEVEPGMAPIQLSTAGEVSEGDRRYAIDKITKQLETTDEPVLHTSIRLQRAGDPARERPALARVTVDLNGEPVRAHVAAHTIQEAVDLLEARLRHRLEHLADHRRALRRRGPTSPPGEWRHGDLPADRPPFYPRRVEEREVVRHKAFTEPEVTVDEAILDLEALDYDFFLFTDLATGQDAVVSRREGGAYTLQHLHGPPDDTTVSASAVQPDPRPAPELTFDAAVERLDSGHEPWVFFRDATSGRGHVLYRRYDGHYGLISPTGEATQQPAVHRMRGTNDQTT